MATASKRRTKIGRKQGDDSKSRLAAGKRSAPLLPFRPGRGGARPGSGRKPKIAGRPGVDHRRREPLAPSPQPAQAPDLGVDELFANAACVCERRQSRNAR